MPKIICKTCGVAFLAPQSRTYCSIECAVIGRTKRKENNCKCNTCGKEFHKNPSQMSKNGKNYCSRKCFQLSLLKEKVLKVCKICGKEFVIYPSCAKRGIGITCSNECRMDYLKILNTGESHYNWKGGKIERTCKFCGKIFSIHPSELNRKNRNTGSFCSKSCSGKYYCKEKSSSWQGGITPPNKRERNGHKTADWRKSVYERDDYTCQKCGKRGGVLNAHHIIPFSIDKSLRFEVSNGITLCAKCHKKEHIRLSKQSKVQTDIFDIYQRRKYANDKQKES